MAQQVKDPALSLPNLGTTTCQGCSKKKKVTFCPKMYQICQRFARKDRSIQNWINVEFIWRGSVS